MKTFVSLAVALIIMSWLPASLSRAKIPPAVTTHRPKSPKYIAIERFTDMTSTAYYSPEKGQKRYSKKPNGQMRTYWEEIRLQGEGKVTASGHRPRIGTIAVNKGRFPYGSILRVWQKNKTGKYEVIFIGIAEDTGETMINNKWHIDIYMGKGELGLARAEKFDVRHDLIVEVLQEVKS